MTGRLMVTGATGFIGSALVTAGCQAGYNIRATVRERSRALPSGIDQVVVPDIGPGTDWGSLLDGVDVVLHVAGRAHVLRDRVHDPLTAFRHANTAGTLRLAEQAIAAGVPRFVFISSVGVNGNGTTARAFSETDLPNPQEHYAISKREAEEGLRSLAAKTGLEVVIIRPPLVYGPKAPGNFGRLYRLVQRGTPLPLGAIRNRRSWVALDNLVHFILTCVEKPAAADETFLVSDGEDLSTPEFIRRLARAMGRSARLIPVPVPVLMAGATLLRRRGLAQRLLGSLQVDISKAREVLGWVPIVSVEEGLRRAVAGSES